MPKKDTVSILGATPGTRGSMQVVATLLVWLQRMAEAYDEGIQLAQSVKTSAARISPTAEAAHTAAERPGLHEVPQESAAAASQHPPGSTDSSGNGQSLHGRADGCAGQRNEPTLTVGRGGQDTASCRLQGKGTTAKDRAEGSMPPSIVDLGMLADGGGHQGSAPLVQGWLLRLSWARFQEVPHLQSWLHRCSWACLPRSQRSPMQGCSNPSLQVFSTPLALFLRDWMLKSWW